MEVYISLFLTTSHIVCHYKKLSNFLDCYVLNINFWEQQEIFCSLLNSLPTVFITLEVLSHSPGQRLWCHIKLCSVREWNGCASTDAQLCTDPSISFILQNIKMFLVWIVLWKSTYIESAIIHTSTISLSTTIIRGFFFFSLWSIWFDNIEMYILYMLVANLIV